MIRDMDIVRYFANGKSFKLDDRIANARIFSREVEHSEETLEILEDDISFDEAFHVKHLLDRYKNSRVTEYLDSFAATVLFSRYSTAVMKQEGYLVFYLLLLSL